MKMNVHAWAISLSKMHKISRIEIMSLGCLQDSVPTRKLQDLGIAKQYNLFVKLDSIKSTKKQHACNDGRTKWWKQQQAFDYPNVTLE